MLPRIFHLPTATWGGHMGHFLLSVLIVCFGIEFVFNISWECPSDRRLAQALAL